MDIETDKQTDGQTDRQTNRQTDRQTDRQLDENDLVLNKQLVQKTHHMINLSEEDKK